MQQEVVMLTPSCVAPVDVLINGQILSIQAHRNALTLFTICPLLVLLLVPSITSIRALAKLSFRCFQVLTLMLFLVRVRKRFLRLDKIHPNLVRT